MTWPTYDDRYNVREAALAAYLQARLDAELFFVGRNPDESSSTGEAPFIVLVRYLGFGPPKMGTAQPRTDGHNFSILCMTRAMGDYEANQAVNYITDRVVGVLRAPSMAAGAYACFGDTLGKPLGWAVNSMVKGANESDELVGEVELSVQIIEDYTAPSVAAALAGCAFPDTEQGAAAPSQTILLANTGALTLVVGTVTAPEGFTAAVVPETVPVGEVGQLVLTFDDTSTAGTFTGTLAIATSAGTLQVPVACTIVEGA